MSALLLESGKTCGTCRLVKTLDEFYFRADRGLPHASCKACQRTATAAWRSQNPERAREQLYSWRDKNMDKMTAATERWRERNPEKQQANARRYGLRRFGITPEQYDAMLASQQFSCAICHTHQTAFKKRLAVDHNHETGKVRALLCDNCNKGIGCLQEDQAILAAAAAYLKEHANQ